MNKDQLKAAFAKGARIQAWHLLQGATNSNQGQWDTLTPAEGAEPEFGCEAHLYRVHPEDLSLIAELGQEVGAVACPKCGGKGYTDEGDPEMGSAIMDCYECWPAPVGATLADAAGDSALTLEAARELLAGAARGIARGEYSPAHTSEARELTDAMVEAALDAQPFTADNVSHRVWQLVSQALTDEERRTMMRAALDAAMRQEGGNG